MKFIPAPPQYKTTILQMISEGGRWQLSLDQYAYGARVHLGPANLPVYSTDYCAGPHDLWQRAVFNAVLMIAEHLPEEIAISDLEAIFPQQDMKPMDLDPACFERLLRLATEPELLARPDSLR